MKSQVPWKVKLERASGPKNPHLTEAPTNWLKGTPPAGGGGTMVIPSALELDAIIRQVPKGQTISVTTLREQYAKKHRADITCPLTTGIFLRIIAENAEEERSEGKKDVTPYWRVRDDNGNLLPKLKLVLEAHHQKLED